MRILIILIAGFTMINKGSCQGQQPDISIQEIRELQGVASASGIENLHGDLFVIGDNTPYIFRLNKDLQVEEKHLLFPELKSTDSLFEKAVKPDLEALCKPKEAENKLWLFGSGSRYKERDVLIVFDAEGEPLSRQFSLVDFYKDLRSKAQIPGSDFNIEGAEVAGEHLYLFNRGNNMIFKINISEFEKFLTQPASLPAAEFFEFELPEIDGVKAGFSGVTFIPGEEIFLITASVEDTDNWIDDGEVLGSYVGVLTLKELKEKVQPLWIKLTFNGVKLQKKIESITSISTTTRGEYDLLMVTDSDGDISEIIKARLTGL
ncbi:hypothetical protein FHG64_16515 [Antarcticibacterium flavum]|uniref:Esterase-like activity of phytase family protein n=1 Tax=Antarcticibacterium flavum TaxID=2058175 RepID=A0A5B7X635_9FLAO|nr:MULTISPECIES: hypothetical protein [Antarcticibacterium]MCM4159621.1 hypothetical protein [Antarcticibacterium sp. W02-3]QCY70867.1 hypothetical protein FHG64_16515 [Antarcticibacterium flavum]